MKLGRARTIEEIDEKLVAGFTNHLSSKNVTDILAALQQTDRNKRINIIENVINACPSHSWKGLPDLRIRISNAINVPTIQASLRERLAIAEAFDPTTQTNALQLLAQKEALSLVERS